MNAISLIFYIIEIVVLITDVRADCLDETDIVEKLYWTPKNESRNIQWEFFIIGKRVAWDVGRMLCSSRTPPDGPRNEESIEDTLLRETPTTTRWNSRNLGISGLAVLHKANMKPWLARMLSESNYHYDGLWVGGHRNGPGKNWTWIESEEREEIPVPSSSIVAAYPGWYKTDKVLDDNLKNCLIFERTGHNLPVLVPTDCKMKKPFVCSRIVTKELPPTIVKGTSVTADGYRYTIFTVDTGDEMSMEKNSGFRRLSGGGVKWMEARLECRKRGQYLATVLSIEAAKKIASIMLKNRPSIESVWLGGWSSDGTEWKWSTTGLVLPSTHGLSGHYPPWLNGHPIANNEIDQNDGRHSRCLILDRHLCPQHISPVFLDLDCNKNRPFVCQDGVPARRYGQEIIRESNSNEFSVNGHNYRFSRDRMTWNEGRVFCSKSHGIIASILDSKTLSTILDRMADLYLDHVWVGGKTVESSEGWKWVDETGKRLESKGIGMQSFWCLGNDESALLKAEPDSCLNLDREGHGLPLFYGLPCNFTRQHVLCSFHNISKLADSPSRRSGKNLTLKDSGVGSRSISLSLESINGKTELNPMNFNDTLTNRNKDGNKINATRENDFSNKNGTERGARIANLGEKTTKLLAANDHNTTNSDLILDLDLKLVDLQNNSTVKKINETRNL